LEKVRKLISKNTTMEFQEILSFADEVIVEQTGKPMSDLQRDILEETLQGYKYNKIAEEHGVKVDYVREVASDLWKAFSKAFGYKVKRSNLRTSFEKAGFTIISSDFRDFRDINHVNFCSNNNNSTVTKLRNNQLNNTPYLDLEDAPIFNKFYGRETELKTLSLVTVELLLLLQKLT
jgi:hypothetical protein